MANRKERKELKRKAKSNIKQRKAEEKAREKAMTKAEKKAASASSRQEILATLGGYDFGVVALVVILSLFGVAMVFSAGYYETINFSDPDPLYYLRRQLFFVVSGLVIMFIFANLNYRIYKSTYVLTALISLAMLVIVMFIGTSVNQAQRWIDLGFIRITPSEFSKVLMIMFTSGFLASNPKAVRTIKGLAVLLLVMGLHFWLIISQPNLSTAIVIVAIMIAIMLVAGLNIFFMIIPAIGVIGLYFYIITSKTPLHWYKRIESFMNPFADRQGDGYQVTQGLIALGNGGLKGLGFGRSVSKNLYLPEPQNDFILAIIGEELGFIGFLILMLLYIILLFRLFMIALKARDRLGLYLATGVAVMLGLQVVINVAVVTSSMPATGITLPFISYGGTSIWAFMIAMGLALNVSKRSNAYERFVRQKRNDELLKGMNEREAVV